MPMGVTHRAINTVVSVPVAVGTLYIGWTPLQAVCLIGGYTFATYLMNPDLDLDSIGYQSWGWLRIIWWPYQKALGHRCWMSHFPVISTLLRIVYLLWFPVLLLLLLGSSVRAMVRQEVMDWFPELAPYLLLIIFGMILSDTLHTVLDTFSTELKQFFGGSRRRKRNANFFEHHHQATPRRASSRKGREAYNKRATNRNRR